MSTKPLSRFHEDEGYYEDDKGVSHQSLNDLIEQVYLNTCGCGKPDIVRDYVLGMLRLIDEKKFYCQEYLDHCKSEAGMFFLLYWLDNEQYTEHGTSVYGSWLTDKGKQLMSDLEELEKIDK